MLIINNLCRRQSEGIKCVYKLTQAFNWVDSIMTTTCLDLSVSSSSWCLERAAVLWLWHSLDFSLNFFCKGRQIYIQEKVREKSRKCHDHKPQPFPDTKRKRKQTKLNKRKSNKRTKSTKTSSLFPKRGNCNTKRTEKHKNKVTQGKT